MPVSIRKMAIRRQKRVRLLRVVTGLVVCILSSFAFVPYIVQWANEQSAIAAMHAREAAVSPTATPTARPTATPSPTPTPSVTPTPTSTPVVDWQHWQLGDASLSYEKAGIINSPIHEILPEEIVTKIVFNEKGEAMEEPMVSPNTKHGFTWYTVHENGVRTFPVGGIISSQSQGAVVLYCHNYRDKTSDCTPDMLTNAALGDIVVITTSTEVLTYELVDMSSTHKGDFHIDPTGEFLYVVTCDSNGAYATSHESMNNSVLQFKLLATTKR